MVYVAYNGVVEFIWKRFVKKNHGSTGIYGLTDLASCSCKQFSEIFSSHCDFKQNKVFPYHAFAATIAPKTNSTHNVFLKRQKNIHLSYPTNITRQILLTWVRRNGLSVATCPALYWHLVLQSASTFFEQKIVRILFVARPGGAHKIDVTQYQIQRPTIIRKLPFSINIICSTDYSFQFNQEKNIFVEFFSWV